MHEKRKESIACPFLPQEIPPEMSFRDLRQFGSRRDDYFADAAKKYSQYLWKHKFYARALLALTRAIYSKSNNPTTLEAYAAYSWFLKNYPGDKFLGNPRISFYHQATRIKNELDINRKRAWALWYLTRKTLPVLTKDPLVDHENPPEWFTLINDLNQNERINEGTYIKNLYDSISPSKNTRIVY